MAFWRNWRTFNLLALFPIILHIFLYYLHIQFYISIYLTIIVVDHPATPSIQEEAQLEGGTSSISGHLRGHSSSSSARTSSTSLARSDLAILHENTIASENVDIFHEGGMVTMARDGVPSTGRDASQSTRMQHRGHSHGADSTASSSSSSSRTTRTLISRISGRNEHILGIAEEGHLLPPGAMPIVERYVLEWADVMHFPIHSSTSALDEPALHWQKCLTRVGIS